MDEPQKFEVQPLCSGISMENVFETDMVTDPDLELRAVVASHGNRYGMRTLQHILTLRAGCLPLM